MLYGGDPMPNFTHRDMPNPLVGTYKTKDDRYITLMMLQGDKFYPEFVTVIGRDDLIEDKRFADGHSRFENRGELIDILDDEFAARTVDQWRGILKPLSGAWSVLQKSSELRDDPAVVANGYIPTVNAMNGAPYILPTNPVQFDEHHVQPTGAPEHGQHTEEVLLAAGIDWEKIEQYNRTDRCSDHTARKSGIRQSGNDGGEALWRCAIWRNEVVESECVPHPA
jgi:crotonobetainyl-CoA:carnitine CoA-transferase CaiB-like acyl-CoA transferase